MLVKTHAINLRSRRFVYDQRHYPTGRYCHDTHSIAFETKHKLVCFFAILKGNLILVSQ
jgi:hypothetical protein